MELVLIGLFTTYGVLVVMLFIGWTQAVNYKVRREHSGSDSFITVLIPARNESANIEKILTDLNRQSYTAFEVIIIDDHSDDDTLTVAGSVSLKNLIVIQSNGVGKKQALSSGIKIARGNIIVTTDADCRVNSGWLKTINNAFKNDKVKFAFGGVRINEGSSFFGSLQQLEFSSLIGSGVATYQLGFPTMCNGANIAFRREVFEEVGGYNDNLHIPSGDDEFLMRKVGTLYHQSLFFLYDNTSVVTTHAVESFKTFIHQRLRWAGKWRYHGDKRSSILALFVFVVQLATLATFALMLSGFASVFLLVAWLFKITIELIFLARVNSFLSNRWNWLSFIFLQFVYPIYVIFIGLSSNVSAFEWKGRKLKSIQSKSMVP